MDVLAIILACSLHPDDALVRTLVDVQSEGNVYFVGDLKTLKSKDWLKSADAALQYADELRSQGGRPAVGLLGIPLDWASRYGRTPIELFDACTNIAVGTAAFAEYQSRCSADRGHPKHPKTTGHRRQARQAFATAASRTCILTRFARDLGLSSAPSALLRRLAPGQRPDRAYSVGASPERSGIFDAGVADGASSRATRARCPSFWDRPRRPPTLGEASEARRSVPRRGLDVSAPRPVRPSCLVHPAQPSLAVRLGP